MNNKFKTITNWPLTIFLGVCLFSPIFWLAYYQKANKAEDTITEICRASEDLQIHSPEKHSYEEWGKIIEAEMLEPLKGMSKEQVAAYNIQMNCNRFFGY
ncbi:MAG: hypothetical protein ACKE5Q_00075 [Methylophilaceae bacterium]